MSMLQLLKYILYNGNFVFLNSGEYHPELANKFSLSFSN